MAKLGGEIKGLDEVLRNLEPGGIVRHRVVGAATRAMIENVEDLVGRAMRDAPLDEGTLRASGDAKVFVGGREVASGGPAVDPGAMAPDTRAAINGRDAIVGVVGFNTPYALVQHERLDFKHPKGGKAKYLEDPFKAQSSKYSDNMRERVGEALG